MNSYKSNPPDSNNGCQQDLTHLMDFVLKKLSSDQHELIEKHLNDCLACRQIVEELNGVTPESTRKLFADVSGEPGEPEVCLPFPLELAQRIADFQQKHAHPACAGTHRRQTQRLRECLDELVRKTRIEIDNILAAFLPEGLPLPAYSAVRSSRQMVQMDIINLSGRDLDESHLRVSAQQDRWTISGYPAEFIHCAGYLVAIPIADLQSVLPEWNRVISQDLLTSFLSNDPEALTLPGISVASGLFVSRSDDICLEFSVSVSQSRLIQATDRIATAVLIVEK